MQRVEIVEYKPEWRTEYASIAERLGVLGRGNVLRIDHIGSTSVPGLAAKDVIDIQVTVRELGESAHIHALEAIGFRRRLSVQSDTLTGLDPYSPELRKQFFREPEGERRTHIHIREYGRLNQRYALLFRGYLRADSGARQAYEAVKRRLAEVYPSDVDGYLSLKDPVMDLIYRGAEHWARGTHWNPDRDVA